MKAVTKTNIVVNLEKITILFNILLNTFMLFVCVLGGLVVFHVIDDIAVIFVLFLFIVMFGLNFAFNVWADIGALCNFDRYLKHVLSNEAYNRWKNQ